MVDPLPSPHVSSRVSAAAAGWTCESPGSLLRDASARLSWMRPGILWRARNDSLARLLGDPTERERQRWVRACLARGAPADFVIARPDLTSYSALVLGDTGEGDASQFATIPPLLAAGADTSFMIIASDVIYPAGDAADYPSKFYTPYARYAAPIYALPGNHDWYDGLDGFMRVFCGVRMDWGPDRHRPFTRGWLRGLVWRRSDPEHRVELEPFSTLRPPAQPGPYFAIDTPPLLFIGIDTGIRGQLDEEQGAWLRRLAYGSPRPKVLVTGKPLIEHNAEKRCAIEGGGTVNEIVRDPAAHFVAAIGGDVHNYQRYPVRLADGRTLQYIVSGGGGAFMHETHTIPRVNVCGVREEEFRCYPLRGDSLSAYSRVFDRLMARICRLVLLPYRVGTLRISPDEAMAIMSERIGIVPVRPAARGLRITRRGRTLARAFTPVVHASMVHRYVSEIFDWNDPPFFKHFLRLDVTPETLRIRCIAATGCGEHEADPPVEDDCVIDLT